MARRLSAKVPARRCKNLASSKPRLRTKNACCVLVKTESLDTHNKALKVNLDPRWYGTFAEIGAGQEVARWFFRVGAAAGTISQSISAYDMKVSDAIYGHSERYV